MSQLSRKVRLALLVSVGLTIVPATAYAQASLTGLVSDTSGAVLPGVTVEAASPALIEQVRVAVTDGTGQYRIVDLRPGAYTVTFTLPGFATVLREGIELTGTFVATVNAELRVGTLEETITVTGESPLVDVQSVTSQDVFDDEVLNVLPTGRQTWSFVSALPGVVDTSGDVGGLMGEGTGGGRGGVQTRGVDDIQMLVGGVSIKTSTSSAAAAILNIGAYEEVAVDTGGLGTERSEGGARMNFIPREGGNTFSGQFFSNFATSGMQGDNVTQDLLDRGLRAPNSLKKLWEFNPGVGGPIIQDRVWFHYSARHAGAQQNVQQFFNKNAGNPDVWTYEADTSRQFANENTIRNYANVRFTWQATQKHKFGFTFDGNSGYDIRSGGPRNAPEAHMSQHVDMTPRNRFFVDWTAPVTNRILLQSTITRYWSLTARPRENLYFPRSSVPLIEVREQSTGLRFRGTSAAHRTLQNHIRGVSSISYVTGAHGFKAGVEYGGNGHDEERFSPDAPMEFRFRNGVPNRITLHARPFTQLTQNREAGAYVQDRWTINRLTLNGGFRYTYYTTYFPETFLGPGQFTPDRGVVFPKTDGVTWHDLGATGGMAFDLTGDGRTALKVNLGKFLPQSVLRGDLGRGMAPVARIVTSTTRSWRDRNGDFVPDCDLINPRRNGECGSMRNSNFGSVQPGLTIDPDVTNGWGKTPEQHWQFSASVQREILPRVSAEVTYWRTWYGNFLVEDDRAVSPADFDQFSITAPVDPRLPGGGGNVLGGLYDINEETFGAASDELLTFASKFGKQTEHWNGIDLSLSARPGPGVTLRGGTSTWRRSTNDCDVVTKVDNPSTLFCDVRGTFLNQFKFLASYVVPRIDLQVTGYFKSTPGPEILAEYTARNSEVRPSLGRSLAGGERNVDVPLIEPRSMYGDRRHQLDLRIGKILRFGRTTVTPTFDLYNALNASTVLELRAVFGRSWLRPDGILPARFAKVGLNITF